MVVYVGNDADWLAAYFRLGEGGKVYPRAPVVDGTPCRGLTAHLSMNGKQRGYLASDYYHLSNILAMYIIDDNSIQCYRSHIAMRGSSSRRTPTDVVACSTGKTSSQSPVVARFARADPSDPTPEQELGLTVPQLLSLRGYAPGLLYALSVGLLGFTWAWSGEYRARMFLLLQLLPAGSLTLSLI